MVRKGCQPDSSASAAGGQCWAQATGVRRVWSKGCSKYGQKYVTQSTEAYEAKPSANMLKTLKRKAADIGFQLTRLPTEKVSRSRPSPSRDRPVATHNPEEPTPRASLRNARRLGEVCAPSRAESTNNVSILNQCRWPNRGTSWGGWEAIQTNAPNLEMGSPSPLRRRLVVRCENPIAVGFPLKPDFKPLKWAKIRSEGRVALLRTIALLPFHRLAPRLPRAASGRIVEGKSNRSRGGIDYENPSNFDEPRVEPGAFPCPSSRPRRFLRASGG